MAAENTIPGELVEAIQVRLDAGDKRMESIEEHQVELSGKLAENTDATRRIEANTSELLDFFNALSGAFKVLNWIGALAKPIGYVVGACTAVYGAWLAFRNGSPR